MQWFKSCTPSHPLRLYWLMCRQSTEEQRYLSWLRQEQEAFEKLIHEPDLEAVFIDLTDTIAVDSTTLGFLAKISIQTKKKFNWIPTIITVNDDITRLLMSMGFDQVFLINKEPIESSVTMGEVPVKDMSEEDLRKKVLEAHEVLMQLNDENRDMFRDLVVALQHEQEASTIH